MTIKSTYAPLAALFLAAFLASGCGSDSGLKDTPPDVKLYGVKSASIEYEYTGDAKGGKSVLIANYGMYERDKDDFTISMGGQPSEVKSLSLRCDTVNYQIDLKKKEGMSSPFERGQLKDFVKDFTPAQLENVNAELIKKMMGGVSKGTETILGKECEIFELPGGGTLSMWKGLIMRQDMPMGGFKFGLVAKKLETDVAATIADFTPPDSIKINNPQNSGGMPPGHPPVDQQ